MIVMIVYVLLVVAGEVVAIGLGSMLDQYVASGWSMIVAMALFFGVIAMMWPLAVFITERWLVSEPAK
jgi:F0F1-type ATP synthase assembly protein I